MFSKRSQSQKATHCVIPFISSAQVVKSLETEVDWVVVARGSGDGSDE